MARLDTIKTVLVAMIVAAAFVVGSALHRDAPATPQGVLGAGVYVPADAARQSGGRFPGERRPGYHKPGFNKPGERQARLPQARRAQARIHQARLRQARGVTGPARTSRCAVQARLPEARPVARRRRREVERRMLNLFVRLSAAALAAAGVLFALQHGTSAAPALRNACGPRLAQIVGSLDARAGRPTSRVRLSMPARSAVYASTRATAQRRRRQRAPTLVVVCWGGDTWKQLGRITAEAFGDSTARTGGFVSDGQQVVNLPGRLCRYLDLAAYEHAQRVDRWTAWAFKNLTHEGVHVAGVVNEAATECYAMQLMARTIESLGLGGRYARALTAVSWSRYPRLRKLAPVYWTGFCHDGGPYDLARERSPEVTRRGEGQQ